MAIQALFQNSNQNVSFFVVYNAVLYTIVSHYLQMDWFQDLLGVAKSVDAQVP